jgi:serine/threonine-protein kinase
MQFGPYWLDARLAVGGTAEVYLARPIDPDEEQRRIVVKRLLPHFVGDPEGRTMFEREAALHAAVLHENVVTVFGSGTADGGEPWLAMEYVEGVDLYRLLRKLSQESRKLPIDIAVYLAREVLRGLAAVHTAKDATGAPMGIIHRDVTPSNLYLANDGRVKLGDFGIARSATRMTMRNAASAMLKGKFAYLAPEQVAGEPFDHRADLFAMAVVLAEMVLGKPLFSGTGQLAVLLAIRDCRIDPLRKEKPNMPAGLFEVLESALSRDPAGRFQSAASFAASLKSFDVDPLAAKHELGALVRWVQSAPSTEQMQAVRDSARAVRAAVRAHGAPTDAAPPSSARGHAPKPAAAPPPPAPPAKTKSSAPPKSAHDPRAEPEDEDEHSRTTGEYTPIPSYVETAAGSRFGPWPFARLVEAIATGEVGRGDKVEYMGRPLVPIEEIDELARFLPARTLTTSQVAGIGAPDFVDDISIVGLLHVMLRVLEGEESGVLFADRMGASGSDSERSGGGRKELYFKAGKLHHVASNNATELLGEYLVRRKMISREELDFALAVLPRYGGRMGDTLISLGLVSAVDIFRAIREQGKDRITDLFGWKMGRLTLYLNQAIPHVEFPLDLDLATLMLAGLEAAQPGEVPVTTFRPYLDATVGPSTTARPRLRMVSWPPLVQRVLELAQEPLPLRELLANAARPGEATPADALRALQVLLAGKLLAWL